MQRHHKHMSLAMKADLTLRVNCGLVGGSYTDKVDVYMSRGIFFYASLLLKWLKNGEYIECRMESSMKDEGFLVTRVLNGSTSTSNMWDHTYSSILDRLTWIKAER